MRILCIQSPHSLSPLAESASLLTPKVFLTSGHPQRCDGQSANCGRKSLKADLGAHTLYLELDCTQKAFGGEARQLLKAEQLTDAFVGSDHRLVVVDRPEWAQAFLQGPSVYLAPGKSLGCLRALPVERLAWVGDPAKLSEEKRDREKLAGFLKKVGLQTIGDFLDLPLSSVHRRFGKAGEVLHQWTSGQRPVCLPLFHAEAPLLEKVDADDLYNLDALLFRLRQILVRVEARLRGRSRAAKRLRLVFHFESHPAATRFLELSEPMQDAQAILKVLKEFLAGFHWESPLTRLELEVQDTLAHAPGQLSLFDETVNKFSDLAQYVARLKARMGNERAGFAALKPSHLPERSFSLTWPPPKESADSRADFPRRPLFLFTPPKPFTPSPQWGLTLTENLFTEWWEPGGSRQYFVAQRAGECLWVYRDALQGGWYAHGVFH